MLPLKTILHPTDFSDHSEYALQLACGLARDSGARLILMHVVPPPIAHGEVVARRQRDGYHAQLEKELNRLVPPDPQIRVARWLEDGDPATVIVQVAQDLPCDLIVMGTHGRTGVRRLLMGSVAEHVVRNAPCPVLTVANPYRGTPPAEGRLPQVTNSAAE